MSRKDKVNSQRNSRPTCESSLENVKTIPEELEQSSNSIIDEKVKTIGVNTVENVVITGKRTGEVSNLLVIVGRHSTKADCSEELIDYMKREDIIGLEKKIQEECLRDDGSVKGSNSVQLKDLRDKLEIIKTSSAVNIVDLKKENSLLEEKVTETTARLDNSKKVVRDLEAKLIATRLVSEAQKPSSSVRNALDELIKDQNNSSEDPEKLLDSNVSYVSTEELRKIKIEYSRLLEDEKRNSEIQKRALEQQLESFRKEADIHKVDFEVFEQQIKCFNEELQTLRANNANLEKSLEKEKLVSENIQNSIENHHRTNTTLMNEEQFSSTFDVSQIELQIKLDEAAEFISKMNKDFSAKVVKFTNELENCKTRISVIENENLQLQENEKKLQSELYISRQIIEEERKMKKELENKNTSMKNVLDVQFSEILEEMENVKKEMVKVTLCSEKVVEENLRLLKTINDLETGENLEDEDKENKVDVKYSNKLKFSNQKVNKLEKDVKKLLKAKSTSKVDIDKLTEEINTKTVIIDELTQSLKSSQENERKVEELVMKDIANQKLIIKLESRISELQRSSGNCQRRLETNLAVTEKKFSEISKKADEQEQQITEVQQLLNSSTEEVRDQEELKNSIVLLENELSDVRRNLEMVQKLAKEKDDEYKLFAEIETKKVEVLEKVANDEIARLNLTLDTVNQVKNQLQKQVELLTVKLDERNSENVKLLTDINVMKEKLVGVEKDSSDNNIKVFAESKLNETQKVSTLEKDRKRESSVISQLDKENVKFPCMFARNDEVSSLEKLLAGERTNLASLEKELNTLRKRFSKNEKELIVKNKEIQKLKVALAVSEKKHQSGIELEKEFKKVSLLETEISRMKEEIGLVRDDFETKERFEKMESELREAISSKENTILEKNSKISDLMEELKELDVLREKNIKLEKRIEVLQQSAGARHKRVEEELLITRKKMEDAMRKLIEIAKEDVKVADLERRLNNFTSESIVQKQKIMADLEKVREDLAESEKSRKSDAEVITKLEQNLVEVRSNFEEEKNHLAAALESTQKKLTAANEAKDEDSKIISELENTVKSLQLTLECSSSEDKSGEVVKKEGCNVIENNNLEETSMKIVNELDVTNFATSARSLHSQLSKHLEILRQNRSLALYPYIRYLIALYILFLHIWLLW